MGDLLGIPPGYRERFQSWVGPGRRIADLLQVYLRLPDDQPDDPAAFDSVRQLQSYLRELIAAKQNEPGGQDLLSRLAAIEASGDRLTETELLSTAMLLIGAGHSTTVRLISNAVLALLRHPGQLAALRHDPDLVPGAVEEVLRFDPPTQLLSHRSAIQSFPVGDLNVPAGSFIVLLFAAANRDPEIFPDPDRFDITRDSSPSRTFRNDPLLMLRSFRRWSGHYP